MKETQYSETFNIWRGKNNKLYKGLSGRGPNQYTGSRGLAQSKMTKLGHASSALTGVSAIATYLEYNETSKQNWGSNMQRYLRNKHYRNQAFNAVGLAGVYGTAASIGYNLGYLIEDIGQWLTNNPDFRIRINPYTMDFTPIEKTLQEYDRLGITVY